MVTDSLYPWNFGGKEERIRSLQASNLISDDTDFEIIYATMKWWSDTPPEGHVAISKLRPMYKNSKRSVVTSVLFALSCFRVIRLRPDIIEADQIPILPVFTLKIVSWITRAPMSVTWHEVWSAQYWNEYLGHFGRVAFLLEKWAMRIPDQIVAVSIPTRFKLIREGVAEEKIELIQADVDRKGLENASTKLAGADALFAGRLFGNKRLHIALEAIAQLKAEGFLVTLAIVGDGPEYGHLKSLAKELNISRQVIFHGFLENNFDVWGLMKKCPIFISPSTREGFGFSVAEAHFVGARVIMADHPENAASFYYAGDERVVSIESDEPKAYADAIREQLKVANISPALVLAEESDLYDKYTRSWLTLLHGKKSA
jgi:glycosyltransferase involved in cell wall biosynthesis